MTKDLIAEMERCLAALRAYEKNCAEFPKGYYSLSNPAHAAAKRATMDTTKMLARWRQTPVNMRGAK